MINLTMAPETIKNKNIQFGFSLDSGHLTSVQIVNKMSDAQPNGAGWLKDYPEDSDTEEFKLADAYAWLAVNVPGRGDSTVDLVLDKNAKVSTATELGDARLDEEMIHDGSSKSEEAIYFSETAHQNGFGSMPHKSVCGQTKREREIVKAGGVVIFDCGRVSGGANGTGTRLRQITYTRGYWNPRVPREEIIKRYEAGDFIQEVN